MSSQRRSLAAVAASFTLLSGLMIAGCQQNSPAGPSVTDIRLAKGGGGGKGPKVDAADPPSAPQDTTLDVRVLGSGFDNGAAVTFTIEGTPQPELRTNATTFVNDDELVANVTIDVDAPIDLYDVEVVSRSGKKGTGADLFRVRIKGERFNYTITDLGAGSAMDINDAGLIVGGSASDRAARWIDTGGGYTMELLGDGPWASGPGSWAYAVNASGDAVGSIWVDAAFTERAALWSSSGVALLPLVDPAHEMSNAYDINDAGQISGQSYTSGFDAARAVRWEPDGTATDLGVLPGYGKSIGWAINDLGWVGGSSRPADPGSPAAQHAVLWTVQSDGQISAPLDLHPVPGTSSIVKAISDESGGKVFLAGEIAVEPYFHPVLWVVDVQTLAVTEHVLQGEGGRANAVNAAGEVVVSGPAVWTLGGGADALDPLPSKQPCNTSGRGINNGGKVVGFSGVRGKGRCTDHAVVWTKIN
jgi:uncharacterized membrane protein